MSTLDTQTGRVAGVELDKITQRLTADREHLDKTLAQLPKKDSATTAQNTTRTELETLRGTVDGAEAAVSQARALFAPSQAGTNAARNPGPGVRLAWSFGAVALAAALSFITSVLVGGPIEKPILDSLEAQLGLLGFAVALAAYLQAVGKDLKERLKATEDGEHWQNFWRVLVAEQMIVVVGVAMVARIVAAPVFASLHWWQGVPQAYADRAILAGLAVTILFLAYLHSRQWTRT